MLDFFQYSDLVDTLNKYIKAYEEGNPIVADAVYDADYKKLKEFEKANPTMVLDSSPTRKVGAAIKDGFEKVEHKHKMGSIANINSDDELRDWLKDKIAKGIKHVVLEFKIDGLSLSLRYVDGKLDDAITRGDGSTGDRVYANALQIKSVMQSIPYTMSSEVRGEVVWFKDNFIAVNDELDRMGKKTFSNPRNGAAGTMKLLDSMEVGRRTLDFIAYRIVEGCGDNTLHSEDLTALQKAGFQTSPFFRFELCVDNIEKIVNTVADMEIQRHSLPYLTDGLVIKVDEKEEYDRLGGTSKCPHAFGAYKFPPEIRSTLLKSVEASSGKTGAVTPVANVDTVKLSLTNVSRASLHNWDMLEFLGIYEGCAVNIRKAGEIIPEIISVVGIEGHSKDDYERLNVSKGRAAIIKSIKNLHATNKTLPFIKRPTFCRHCGSALHNDTNRAGEELVALICPNQKCPSLQMKVLEAFVSKDCMNIMNVGESTVNVLVNAGVLKDFTDFYKLTKDILDQIPELGSRESDRIITGIEDSKKNYLNQLLNAFGIDGIGRTASQEIADRYPSLAGLVDVVYNNPADLRNTPKVGEEGCKALETWIKDNNDIVYFFIDKQIASKSKAKIVKGNALAGLTLIMTGKSDLVGRNDFKQFVIEQGGKVASGISSKVSYVLLGNSAGPEKVKEIRRLQADGVGIRTITDQDFLKMIGK